MKAISGRFKSNQSIIFLFKRSGKITINEFPILRTTISELIELERKLEIFLNNTEIQFLRKMFIIFTRKQYRMEKFRIILMRLSANVFPLVSWQARPAKKLDYRMLIEMYNDLFRPKNLILLNQFPFLYGKNVVLPKRDCHNGKAAH